MMTTTPLSVLQSDFENNNTHVVFSTISQNLPATDALVSHNVSAALLQTAKEPLLLAINGIGSLSSDRLKLTPALSPNSLWKAQTDDVTFFVYTDEKGNVSCDPEMPAEVVENVNDLLSSRISIIDAQIIVHMYNLYLDLVAWDAYVRNFAAQNIFMVQKVLFPRIKNTTAILLSLTVS